MAIVETEHEVVVDAGETEFDELAVEIGRGGGEDKSGRACARRGKDMAEGDCTPVKRERRLEDVADSGAGSI